MHAAQLRESPIRNEGPMTAPFAPEEAPEVLTGENWSSASRSRMGGS
jgi:hypothetical protein